LHIFPARKYGLIYDRAIEEKIHPACSSR
jgi:hypothetical protein